MHCTNFNYIFVSYVDGWLPFVSGVQSSARCFDEEVPGGGAEAFPANEVIREEVEREIARAAAATGEFRAVHAAVLGQDGDLELEYSLRVL